MFKLAKNEIGLSPVPYQQTYYVHNIKANFGILWQLLSARLFYFHSLPEILRASVLLVSLVDPHWWPLAFMLYLDCIAVIFYPQIIIFNDYQGKHVDCEHVFTECEEGARISFVYSVRGVETYQVKNPNSYWADPNLMKWVLDDYVQRECPNRLQTWFIHQHLERIGQAGQRDFAFFA